MLEGFRSFAFVCPRTPTIVKTQLVSCPSHSLVSTDFFLFLLFETFPSDLSTTPIPVCPCSLPRPGYLQLFCLPSKNVADVSRGRKHCSLDLECERDGNNLFEVGGGVNPPFMLCKSMYRFVLFVYIIGIIFSWTYVLAAM